MKTLLAVWFLVWAACEWWMLRERRDARIAAGCPTPADRMWMEPPSAWAKAPKVVAQLIALALVAGVVWLSIPRHTGKARPPPGAVE
jgi:hypothetical protein